MDNQTAIRNIQRISDLLDAIESLATSNQIEEDGNPVAEGLNKLLATIEAMASNARHALADAVNHMGADLEVMAYETWN